MKNKLPLLASGVILGAAVGALVTMLFTTDKGKEVQKKIGESADKIKNDLADRIESLKKTIEEKTQSTTKG